MVRFYRSSQTPDAPVTAAGQRRASSWFRSNIAWGDFEFTFWRVQTPPIFLIPDYRGVPFVSTGFKLKPCTKK